MFILVQTTSTVCVNIDSGGFALFRRRLSNGVVYKHTHESLWILRISILTTFLSELPL